MATKWPTHVGVTSIFENVISLKQTYLHMYISGRIYTIKIVNSLTVVLLTCIYSLS